MTDNNLVMEERTKSLVSLRNHNCSFRRQSHFLRPRSTTINAPVLALPPPPGFSLEYKDIPLQMNFPCWRRTTDKWETWVDQMQALHHLTWKQTGIFNAIMSSKSINIHRNNILIYGFVEKWCSATNSFVFPWGEATVTLEDVFMIGGYSSLGDSVFMSPKDDASRKMVKKLVGECSILKRTKAKKVAQSEWMTKFMDKGSEIEHEAFLAYWLSRYVFPMNVIRETVLRIAVHLSRGVRIALAPAVLAKIYQSLSLLKVAVTAARNIRSGGDGDNVLDISVFAPFALVQVWIWERFPTLRPNPNITRENEARITRWKDLWKTDIDDLSMRIDSSAKDFEWRPYMNVDVYYSYEELLRWLRTSELVGLETSCIEQYLPHRVAMQFGIAQDLPGHVARENASPEIAWSNYNRTISDKTFYVPPRHSEPCVTTRYWKWWEKVNSALGGMSLSVHSNVEAIEDSKVKEMKQKKNA